MQRAVCVQEGAPHDDYGPNQEIKVRSRKLIGTLALAVSAAAGSAWAQQTNEDFGRLEYEANCASCHGATGKGDGHLEAYLTKAPTDLTTLSRRHGAGRSSTEIGPHGNREMPVWGMEFRRQALQSPGMAPQPEWYVRGRIVALLDYLARIQTK